MTHFPDRSHQCGRAAFRIQIASPGGQSFQRFRLDLPSIDDDGLAGDILAHRTSSPPCRSTAAFAIASISESLVTSAANALTVAPPLLNSCAAASASFNGGRR